MSKDNLCILVNEKAGSADTNAPVGVPGTELRVPMGKQVLGHLDNIRSWKKF